MPFSFNLISVIFFIDFEVHGYDLANAVLYVQ